MISIAINAPQCSTNYTLTIFSIFSNKYKGSECVNHINLMSMFFQKHGKKHKKSIYMEYWKGLKNGSAFLFPEGLDVFLIAFGGTFQSN